MEGRWESVFGPRGPALPMACGGRGQEGGGGGGEGGGWGRHKDSKATVPDLDQKVRGGRGWSWGPLAAKPGGEAPSPWARRVVFDFLVRFKSPFEEATASKVFLFREPAWGHGRGSTGGGGGPGQAALGFGPANPLSSSAAAEPTAGQPSAPSRRRAQPIGQVSGGTPSGSAAPGPEAPHTRALGKRGLEGGGIPFPWPLSGVRPPVREGRPLGPRGTNTNRATRHRLRLGRNATSSQSRQEAFNYRVSRWKALRTFHPI